MNEKAYIAFTRKTAIYPKDREEEYLLMGLANEVGELLGKHKKEIRGDGKNFSGKLDELGDVMWYVYRLCDHYDVEPLMVRYNNYVKLTDRKERGVIQGDGDNR
jgi:NTP pyrophosphatase (non-canonical NTP hydrolase)